MALLGKAYLPTFAVIVGGAADIVLGMVVRDHAGNSFALAAMILAPLLAGVAIIAITQPTSGDG